jgi:Domain of unknown function (DUF4365)
MIPLPDRHPSHALEAVSRDRFRSIFRDPLFIVRDESSSDYGVDLSIEALLNDGRSPTNIRACVQLKSTTKPPTSSGAFRVNIRIRNINYLANSHCSFYCLYSALSRHAGKIKKPPMIGFLDTFPDAADDYALVRSYLRIKDAKMKRHIVALVRAIAGD